jgi:hypothetical protein
MDGLVANAFPAQDIDIVEIREESGEERRPVCGNGFLDSFEDTAVHSLRVVRRLQ